VNIGNGTSVKLGDIRHIGHRIAIWHRYRFGCWSHSAAGRINAACLPTLGSADNNHCSTLSRVKHACAACVWSPCEISDLMSNARVCQMTAWARWGR